MSTTTSNPAAEWKRHWPLVLASCIGLSFLSLLNPALGVFMGPLSDEFGWGRAELSVGFTIAASFAILLSPLCGRLTDRWGARRVALPGLFFLSLIVASFSLSNGTLGVWAATWLVWGACSLLVTTTVWSTAIVSVFTTGRGLALALAMTGSALAQVVAPPLSNFLIETVGWRGAFVYIGLGWGGLAFALAFFTLFDARDIRRLAAGRGETVAAAATHAGLTVAQAWRSIALWQIAIASLLTFVVTMAVAVHQFQILTEVGTPRDHAAWLLSLLGIAAVCGNLATGMLTDHFHARWVGGFTLMLTAIAYPLIMTGSFGLILLGIMISGYANGTKVQLCSYLTARYAGLRNYGTIFGFMTSITALSMAMGPLFGGVIHDIFGTYTPLLAIGIAASIISGGLILTLGRYPEWEAEGPAEETTPPLVQAQSHG